MDDIEPTCLALEDFANQMISGANAGRPIGQLAGIGLGVGNQGLQILRRHRRMNGEDQCARDQPVDGPEVAHRIGGPFCQGDNDLRAAVAEKKRVAVRLLARDCRSADCSTCAADVLGVCRAKLRRNASDPGTTDLITRSARGVGNDQPNAARRVVGRSYVKRDFSERACACNGTDQLSA